MKTLTTRLLALLLIGTLQLSAIERSDILGHWVGEEKTVVNQVTIEAKEYITYEVDGTCSTKTSLNLSGGDYDIQGHTVKGKCFWKLYKNILVATIEDMKLVNYGTPLKSDNVNDATKELLSELVVMMQIAPIVINEISSFENNVIRVIDEEGLKLEYRRP